MFKKILAAFGIGSATTAATAQAAIDGPYRDRTANLIYQLLFCDRLQLFKEHHRGELTRPWSALFSDSTDFPALAAIAEDTQQESRVRILAFNILRASQKAVTPKEHLGTIIEVRLPRGLDTLAVFADGSARYINQSGKIIVAEGTPNPFEQEIKSVLAASKPIVAAIGPWYKDRLPAPKRGNIRMTFLVSDGLYFGEGSMGAMQKEQMAAPLITVATTLLLKLVKNAGE